MGTFFKLVGSYKRNVHMVCGISHQPFSLEYVEISADLTQVRDLAEDISVVAGIHLGCLIVFEACTQIARVFYNGVVFVINQMSWAVHKVACAAACVFTCGGCADAQPLPNVAYSAEDLLLLQFTLQSSHATAEQPERVIWQNHPYEIWCDDGIHIKDCDAPGQPILFLEVTERGQVASIQLDGVDQGAFPASFAAVMYGCFQKAYELSSGYQSELFYPGGSRISVRLIQRGLVEHPEYHLDRLGEMILDTYSTPSLKIDFLKSDLTQMAGCDAGGLRRDYFDSLFQGLVLNKGTLICEKKEGSDLYMPKASGARLANGFLNISNAEKALYRKMGAAMLCAFSSSERLMIGRRFEDSLFRAAFSLSSRECSMSFEELPQTAIDGMVKEILLERGETSAAADMYIKIFKNDSSHPAEEGEWEAAFHCAERSGSLNVSADFEFIWDHPDHQRQVQDALKQYFQLDSLAPIHAIVGGTRQVERRWNLQPVIEWRNFMERIQGGLNRDSIANQMAFTCTPSVITRFMQNQMRWMQNWIRNPQTPASEISNFLKFVTGSSSFRESAQIQVSASYSPNIEAHTCFNRIDLPRFQTEGEDVTEADYITALRALISEPGGYNQR